VFGAIRIPTPIPESLMTLRVTFDTNVLDYACRPERYAKDPRDIGKMKRALENGDIEGFYSVTMLTIEGVMNRDRAKVFGDTRIDVAGESVASIDPMKIPQDVRERLDDGEWEEVRVEMRASQPGRQPLHPEVIRRVRAAKALGIKVLKDPPRIGAYEITDPDGDWYLDNGARPERPSWTTRVHEVARAIEARGVGIAQVKKLGLRNADAQKAWFDGLQKAKDIHEERAVERAFGEWADGDAVASHIAYGLDVFCSSDVGNSNATNSVLDAENRGWLELTYGVKFMKLDELLAHLP
jgi:hypothetical protein